MSADNWTICPRCRDRAKTEAEARIQAVAEAYGKVDADEYERLRSETAAFSPDDLKTTFREDYEFYGADEGTVFASYSGHCQTCNLGVDFTFERKFYDAKDADRA